MNVIVWSCMFVNVFCAKTEHAFSGSLTAVGTTRRAHLTSTLQTKLHEPRAFFKASHLSRGKASSVLPSSAFCRKRLAPGTHWTTIFLHAGRSIVFGEGSAFHSVSVCSLSNVAATCGCDHPSIATYLREVISTSQWHITDRKPFAS